MQANQAVLSIQEEIKRDKAREREVQEMRFNSDSSKVKSSGADKQRIKYCCYL